MDACYLRFKILIAPVNLFGLLVQCMLSASVASQIVALLLLD